MDGEEICYFENGQIQVQNFYINGQLHGRCVSYYEDGTLQTEKFYKHGRSEGQHTSYYESGRIKGIINCCEGLLDGYYIIYDVEDNILQKIVHKMGKVIEIV